MFLINSRLGLFSATSFEALLFPKLRSHFAEFLNKGYPAHLRILSSPTCVGLRYGHLRQYNKLVSSVYLRQLRYFNFAPLRPTLPTVGSGSVPASLTALATTVATEF